jgi:hypothetical protein
MLIFTTNSMYWFSWVYCDENKDMRENILKVRDLKLNTFVVTLLMHVSILNMHHV